MTVEKFEKLVNEGIKAIPERFLRRLSNVGIVIEEEPTSAQLKKLKIRKDSFIFGLYEGIPQTERWHYGQVLPDKITIFKRPIEESVRMEKEQESAIKEIVKNTVWHEIAHHFGMDEHSVRKIEHRKKLSR